MRIERRPTFTPRDAERWAAAHYGLRVVASALPGERDQNFKLTGKGGAFVLKVAHPDESLALLEAQHQVLERLAALPRKVFPRILRALSGEPFTRVEDEAGRGHYLWLIPWLPGTPLARLAAPSPALLYDIGAVVGQMDEVLSGVQHPALDRTFSWAPQRAPTTMRERLEHVRPAARRRLLEGLLERFESAVAPKLGQVRQSPIHNDANDHNLLVAGDEVTAVLDFGDMLLSYTVCDLAHACAYLMLDKPAPLDVAYAVALGYQRAHPLTELELSVLYDFILLRLALSVTLSAYQRRLKPDDPYLSVSERPAWALLERLAKLEPEAVRDAFCRIALPTETSPEEPHDPHP